MSFPDNQLKLMAAFVAIWAALYHGLMYLFSLGPEVASVSVAVVLLFATLAAESMELGLVSPVHIWSINPGQVAGQAIAYMGAAALVSAQLMASRGIDTWVFMTLVVIVVVIVEANQAHEIRLVSPTVNRIATFVFYIVPTIATAFGVYASTFNTLWLLLPCVGLGISYVISRTHLFIDKVEAPAWFPGRP